MANYNEKIVFGMDEIHIATVNEDGSFGVPVKILGAKAVEASFESTEKAIHADNITVYSDKRIKDGKGKLTVLGLTTTEKALLAGTENMSGGFAVSQSMNAPRLALLFKQDKADKGKLLNVIYNVQFSIPGINAVTTEGEMEEQTFEIDFSCLPELGSGEGYFFYTVDTTDAKADSTMVGKWFTEVQFPKPTVSVIAK
ncbi:phage major tail, phi13 family protein [[Clostridium] bifermentans ATCC 638]|uniref:Phage major tail, phi13 family protein n=1 Tax=Paraclostridium bifermentans ATCC 638 = DSM 14991 TaxID=1233171 RepID=T4VQ73_PARBF|nr:major tail protein [Paraclostridium bifermentans]EQK42911.1 phage major tail, phi13 family protein [[Clostridium] bifermentans ATCC 638] [Paraclostridium bifermentans ATCC 638 = DSM 14991]RIZ58040.1 hypothetical protein CHH45_13405 [Paraclostridium bifermentans]UAG16795.1 hypothetical protein KXZ80_08315 [Paraclostridium bifermentans]